MNYPLRGTYRSSASGPRHWRCRIERYLVAYDVGKAVNPMLVEGQIVGGCAQGIGGTLLEEFLYDERGEPLSVTLADYLCQPFARYRRSKSSFAKTRRARSIRWD